MEKTQTDLIDLTATVRCSKCGGLMRLVGSEPHATKDDTDLITYACVRCEAFEVVPIPVSGASAASGQESPGQKNARN